MACAATLALAAAGCGAQEHANEPRAAPPTRISVAISKDSVTVLPATIGFGAEKSQQIPQNQNHPQPPIKTGAPLNVVFVAANLTETESKLEIRGPKNTTSGPMVANGNGTYLVSLPTGRYTVSAADIPAAKSATLRVGPVRVSSQNDVLLP